MGIRQIKQNTDIHTQDVSVRESKTKIRTTSKQILDEGMTDAEIEMLLLQNLNSRDRMWWNRLSKGKKRKYVAQARNEIKAFHLKNPLASNPVSGTVRSAKRGSGRIITPKQGKAVVAGTVATAMTNAKLETSNKKEELLKGNVDGRVRKQAGGKGGAYKGSSKRSGGKEAPSAARKNTAKAIRTTLGAVGAAGLIKKMRMVRKTRGRLLTGVRKSTAKKTAQKEKLITAKGLAVTGAATSAGGLENGAKEAVKEGAGAAVGMILKAVPLPIRLIIIGLVLLCAILLFILPVLFGGAFSATQETTQTRTSLVPIVITGTYNGSSGTLALEGSTIYIEGIPATGDRGSFTAFKEGTRDATIEDQVYVTLRTNGCSIESACGIMGNIRQESDFRYDMDEYAYGEMNYGLFSMTHGRRAGYMSYCQSHYGSQFNIDGQLEYMLNVDAPDQFESYAGRNKIYDYTRGRSVSFSGSFPSHERWAWWPYDVSISDFKALSDVGEATEIFERVFERAGTPNMRRRRAEAMSFYNLYSPFGNNLDGIYSQEVNLTGVIGDENTVTISGTLGGVEVYTTGTLSGGMIDTSGFYGSGASAAGAGGSAIVVEEARNHLGAPYIWGAQGPNYFDCSGLVYYCYKETGLYTGGRLTAAGYQAVCTPISESEAVPGDLIFYGRPAHHVAIYIGDGQMIHAPHTGDVVKIANIYGNPTFGRLVD